MPTSQLNKLTQLIDFSGRVGSRYLVANWSVSARRCPIESSISKA